MSKTSDANSTEKIPQVYWKRFVGLATGFAHRYRDDLFARTELNIVLLQAVYTLFILGLSIGSLVVLYHEILSGVGAAIVTALTSTTPFSTENIALQLEAVRTREIIGMSVVIVITAVGFGFLVARFALTPARNALALQKQFIGNIAHELRTPLAIIKTNTEVRLLDQDVPKSVRELHESNLEELDRISDIINNLLSLNTLIRPERIPFDEVNLGKITRRVADRFSDLATKKKLRVQLEITEGVIAWGNAVALEQIIMNLVRNALQYTASGSVTISVEPGGAETVTLSVHDTGPGIAPEDLAHIFEPFYRGDRARSRAGGAGSGLGLAIVNELVKLHNGRLRVRSALGKGTSFIVSLSRVQNGHTPGDTIGLMHEIDADFSNHYPTSNQEVRIS